MVYFEPGKRKAPLPDDKCFNPCSNGWCTSSPGTLRPGYEGRNVSILVLMDGVLRVDGWEKKADGIIEFQSLF